MRVPFPRKFRRKMKFERRNFEDGRRLMKFRRRVKEGRIDFVRNGPAEFSRMEGFLRDEFLQQEEGIIQVR